MTQEEALANLKRFSVFGNAYGVQGRPLPDGTTYWTGWIAGSLYSSRDGVKWEAVTALWRVG